MRHYPTARLAIGPTVDNGFYYDVDFGDETFSMDDFPKIQKEMKKIVGEKIKIKRSVLTREEALARWEPEGEIYKTELIRDLPEGEEISIYNQGEFTDLCRGPHVPHTGWLKIVKLMSVAGAYWRGSEKNKMLTRIYGTAWATKDELKDYLHRLEEAEKRDHRKLGKQLELFYIADEVGKGLPLWLPNGTVLRDELEKLAKEKEFQYGYQRVVTPEITKENLYHISGHLAHYKDSMFPPMTLEDEEQAFYLKPMNCPHHHMIFKSRPRSYREMPLRLAEYGRVYRYEKSGELAGLLRVRGMTMNDAHIYCTEDQLDDEFKAVMRMHMEYYKIFGLDDYYMRLSLHDPQKDKFVDNPSQWEKAEKLCMKAMDGLGVNYKVAYGEAAFYGPKVDVQFKKRAGPRRDQQHQPTRLRLIRPFRPHLHRSGRPAASPGDPAPRPAGHSRTLHRLLDRTLRRGLPHMAGSQPGDDRPGGGGVPRLRRETEERPARLHGARPGRRQFGDAQQKDPHRHQPMENPQRAGGG